MGRSREWRIAIWKLLERIAVIGEAATFLWLFLAVTLGVLASLMGYLGIQDRVMRGLTIALIVTAGGLVALAPRAFGRQRHLRVEKLNPNLALEHIEAILVVQSQGVVNRVRRTLEALGPVEGFYQRVTLTGSPVESEFVVTSGGKVKGPVLDLGEQIYEIVFPQPLDKGMRYTCETEHSVNDPDQTMKPFYSHSFSDEVWARVGTLDLKVVFDGRQPTTISKVLRSGLMPSSGTPEKMFLDDGVAHWPVGQTRSGERYVIEWTW